MKAKRPTYPQSRGSAYAAVAKVGTPPEGRGTPAMLLPHLLPLRSLKVSRSLIGRALGRALSEGKDVSFMVQRHTFLLRANIQSPATAEAFSTRNVNATRASRPKRSLDPRGPDAC